MNAKTLRTDRVRAFSETGDDQPHLHERKRLQRSSGSGNSGTEAQLRWLEGVS